MIVSRTPLRISLFGGGTDYPQWYTKHGGQILGGSIDKYVFVTYHNGTVSHCFDLPNKSGLASSSAYTVGLLRVCCNFDNLTLARLATIWEQDKMNGAVGSQDQFLCAVGGFHHLKFSEHGIRAVRLPHEQIQPLENWLMLFDTHVYRTNSQIIPAQVARIEQNEEHLQPMAGLVDNALLAIRDERYALLGELLNESWQHKKQLADTVTTPVIDNGYQLALNSGAVGGKLLGGGGGGFIIFAVPPEKQDDVKNALGDWTHVPFHFEREGSKVIYRD